MSALTQWQLKTRSLDLANGTLVMGIVNATPDSFSDGGQFVDPAAAIRRGLEMADAGVAIIDVGGESTRPYSDPVATDEEIQRVIPVIRGLIQSNSNVVVSIDTSKAAVARAALEAGAEIINDVTGLEGDPEMMAVAQEYQPGVCAMHMRGTPQTMQDDPSYENVVEEIYRYLEQRKAVLCQHGIDLSRICLDPGIGFGKTHQHNLTLLSRAEAFLDLGTPILIGHSRKGFIGNVLADKTVERDSGTLAISIAMAAKGIHIVRVHAATETVRALKMFGAIQEQPCVD
ncbi:MAG: dihydropteroate synthase [Planctomycetota bacterium]